MLFSLSWCLYDAALTLPEVCKMGIQKSGLFPYTWKSTHCGRG